MSLAEWANMPEDEPGELVDGLLVEDEVSDFPHEITVSWLFIAIGLWARDHQARVLGSEAKFAVASNRGRKPDISVFLTRGQKLPHRGPGTIPPDVMIEVVSPTPRDGRRDRVEKLAEYAAFGVRWYWLVDPRLRTLEILRLGDDGHYTYAVSVSEGVIDVPGIEGLRLDLDALWRELDEAIEREPPSSDE
jgi:Uma2 family endonuclease